MALMTIKNHFWIYFVLFNLFAVFFLKEEKELADRMTNLHAHIHTHMMLFGLVIELFFAILIDWVFNFRTQAHRHN